MKFVLYSDIHAQVAPLEAVLNEIDKAAIQEQLPENVAKHYQRFCTCPGCKRIYWEGSHWKRMLGWLAKLQGGACNETASEKKQPFT